MDVKNVLCKGGDLSFSLFVFAHVYMHTSKNVGAFIHECVCVEAEADFGCLPTLLPPPLLYYCYYHHYYL